MQGRGRGNVAAERLCGVLFVGLTPLKGYFYINLGGTLIEKERSSKKIPFSNMIKLIIVLELLHRCNDFSVPTPSVDRAQVGCVNH